MSLWNLPFFEAGHQVDLFKATMIDGHLPHPEPLLVKSPGIFNIIKPLPVVYKALLDWLIHSYFLPTSLFCFNPFTLLYTISAVFPVFIYTSPDYSYLYIPHLYHITDEDISSAVLQERLINPLSTWLVVFGTVVVTLHTWPGTQTSTAFKVGI